MNTATAASAHDVVVIGKLIREGPLFLTDGNLTKMEALKMSNGKLAELAVVLLLLGITSALSGALIARDYTNKLDIEISDLNLRTISGYFDSITPQVSRTTHHFSINLEDYNVSFILSQAREEICSYIDLNNNIDREEPIKLAVTSTPSSHGRYNVYGIYQGSIVFLDVDDALRADQMNYQSLSNIFWNLCILGMVLSGIGLLIASFALYQWKK